MWRIKKPWTLSIPILGSSIQPSIITLHFHEMRRWSSGASASSEYSHNELHRRLDDSSSVASVGRSASRCHSCPHERVGVTAKHQKECAFSTTEDHFSRHGMGLNVDAGTPVTGMDRVHPVGCKKNKARPVTHCQTVLDTVLWQQHPMYYCTWDPCSGGSGPKGFLRGVTPFAWSSSHCDAYVPW